jgi:hypothetical protein
MKHGITSVFNPRFIRGSTALNSVFESAVSCQWLDLSMTHVADTGLVHLNKVSVP